MSRKLRWDRDGHDWPLRDASHFVDAGGVRWHVQVFGPTAAPADDAPTLLLLHGTGASTHSWRELAPLLAAQHRIVAPDLPGHGFSEPLPATRRSLPGMAAAIGALLQALHLRPCAVLGHSAGGALMLRMALDGHLDARVLVGLNAALLPFEGLAGFLYAPMARLLAMNPLVPWLASWRAQDPAAVRRLIQATGSRIDARGVALYTRLMRDPAHVAGVLAMMANWDLEQLCRDLPALKVPLRLLAGERDATVPPAQADRAAALVPHADVHRLPALGHLAHEEAPQRVADEVLAALASLAPASASR